jgi:hypothetical protein
MSHLYLLGVATLTLTSAGFAGSDTNADLQARLEAAETRIAELSAATNNNWLNDARADEIRGLVHDVLADADTRASLQGSGATAGYNGGFTIGSADGNWSMKINGLLQERWIDNSIDPAAGPSEDRRGFENTRTVLNFSGTVASDYGYNVRLDWGAGVNGTPYVSTAAGGPAAATNNANGADVQWAYGTVDLGDGWELAVGNMKLPTNREWMINAEYQLGVERSLASQANLAAVSMAVAGGIGQPGVHNNTTGASLNYVGDEWRLWAMYGNGLGDAPNGVYSLNDQSHTWAVRAEFMLDGADWGQFDQFTSVDGAASGCLIGVSYVRNNWGDNDATTAPNAQNDSNSLITVDGQCQFGGSNLYVAYNHNNIDGATGTGGANLLGYGDPTSFEVQYGIYLDSDWELYARYQDIDWDATGIDNSDSFTVGVNYYLSGQNAKWSTDVSWADSGIAPGDNTTGWGVSAQTDDQTMIRTQLQFHF